MAGRRVLNVLRGCGGGFYSYVLVFHMYLLQAFLAKEAALQVEQAQEYAKAVQVCVQNAYAYACACSLAQIYLCICMCMQNN